MKKTTIGLIGALILSGCSARAILQEKRVDYDSDVESRLRLYQNNGQGRIRVQPNTTCDDVRTDPKKRPSKKPFKAENMNVGLPRRTLRNITIGIPMTESAAESVNRDSYMDMYSFNEQVLPANKPIVISSKVYYSGVGTNAAGEIVHTNNSCGAVWQFQLEAGKDYEAFVGSCRLDLYELTPTGQSIKVEAKNSMTSIPPITAKVGKKVLTKVCM